MGREELTRRLDEVQELQEEKGDQISRLTQELRRRVEREEVAWEKHKANFREQPTSTMTLEDLKAEGDAFGVFSQELDI
jgi:hypothetical protein